MLVILLAGCGSQPGPFECSVDQDCSSSKLGDGICTDYGFCAFPDQRCNSGYRYHESAGELARVCVDEEPFPP